MASGGSAPCLVVISPGKGLWLLVSLVFSHMQGLAGSCLRVVFRGVCVWLCLLFAVLLTEMLVVCSELSIARNFLS